MPQWDFLDFLAAHGGRYPGFRLLMETEAEQLVEEGDRVAGVQARTADGRLEIRAGLTVAADGRHSTLRERAGLVVRNLGAPMDVLWMRFPKAAADRAQTLGRIDAGRIFIMLDRGVFWQCAFVIRKGGIDEVRRRGLPAVRQDIAAIAPDLADRVDILRDWDDVKLLTVAVDRLERWHRPGLLCIGDAAHAMSPIGGVGINLAIQDAVAAANILAKPLLLGGVVAENDLAAVQRRRELPARLTQRLQIAIQNRVITPVLGSTRQPGIPWPLRLLQRHAILRRLPARLIGMGFRPEHVRTPERASEATPQPDG
jgi:2-polyprenyl-6-methoxyphenol hydroxylase-like FAD-dependent oxidoreductase